MKTQVLLWNSQILFEVLCNATFGGLLVYLIKSRRFLMYVTPRMEPYLYFSVIVMGIWVLVGLKRMFRPQHKIRVAHCYALIIPILLLLLPNTALTTADISSRYIDGSSIYHQFSQVQGSHLPGLDVENKKITVANEDFGIWLAELYENMENYIGYTIVITGFIYKDSEAFYEDEFVAARLLMTCCVADLVPIGFMYRYEDASQLAEGSWVTLKGTIILEEYVHGDFIYEELKIYVQEAIPTTPVAEYLYLP